MAFKSDKQRKAVMAKLRGRTTSPVIPIILPLRIITGNVIKRGLRPNKNKQEVRLNKAKRLIPRKSLSLLKKGITLNAKRASHATGRSSRVLRHNKSNSLSPRSHKTGGRVAFSYVTGKKLPGKFRSLKEVFKRFPKEKKVFDKVKRFNKKFAANITTTRQLKDVNTFIRKIRTTHCKIQGGEDKNKNKVFTPFQAK